MAAVKFRDNLSTELKVIALLKKEKITGWRRQLPLVGTPDFCWPKEKIILFIDGCFWHGCPRCHKFPKSNVRFWKNKILSNKKRDRRVSSALRKNDWKVLRVWEHQIRHNPDHFVGKLGKLIYKANRTN
jgi:DNA mismatch endonuclease, patch repair protein